MTIPVNRVKAKKPKTRTGCVTCKQRRVKCDETKPYCKRCTLSRRACGGYTPPHNAITAPSKELFIQPKTMREEDVLLSRASHSRPIFLPFARMSSEEGHAFSFFQLQTAHHLRECFHSELWQRVVLQLAHQEQVILDAVTALGSLHKARSAPRLPSDEDFAHERYSRALRRLYSNMSDVGVDRNMYVVLLACLLFVCFESLRHGQSAAMTHLRYGLRIIHDAFKGELEFAATYHSAVALKGIRSGLVDELIPVFSQMDYDAAILSSESPLRVLAKVQDTDSEERSIPEHFQSIAEAQSCLDLLAFDLVRLQGHLFDIANKVVSNDPNAPTGLGARSAYVFALTRFVPLNNQQTTFEEKHTQLRQQLAAFKAALANLLALPKHAQTAEATPLQLQHILTDYLSANLRNTHESESDTFNPIFKHAIDLAEEYAQQTPGDDAEPSSISTFHFQKGVLRTIYLVGNKCRDPATRRRAVGLLYSSALQEAIWDSTAYAALMQRGVALEEEDALATLAPRMADGEDGHFGEGEGEEEPFLTAADIKEEARFCDHFVAGDLTNPQAARLVLAKYLHSESEKYPRIVIVEDQVSLLRARGSG